MENFIKNAATHSSGGSASSIPSETLTSLIPKVEAFVKTYMSQAHFDASHDYNHILRVLALATHILKTEKESNPLATYDESIVILAALMHDVGDHKYIKTTTLHGEDADKTNLVTRTLLDLGASSLQAHYVQTIVKSVSYSHEIRDPAQVRRVLLHHPELGIVQDADRLDAIGAVGIGRAFTYSGARTPQGGGGMEESIQHFGDKLEKLEGMMKTTEGKRMACERTERLIVFKQWWMQENAWAEVVKG